MGARLLGGAVTVFTRTIPRRTFWPRVGAGVVLGYVFHIGLFVILFGGAPHILVIHEIFGIAWPGLPKGVVAGLVQAGNLCGLPALTMPCGFVNGLPIGLQIVGRPFSENHILALGVEFQKRTDFHKQHPGTAIT